MASSSAARAPGLHTPTQSFSGSPAPTVSSSQATNPNEKKKLGQEIEYIKSRLTDQSWDPRNVPDPLLPREPKSEDSNPSGISKEERRRLLDLVTRGRR